MWKAQQYNAVYKDTYVIWVSSKVTEDLVEIPKEYKTDLWLSRISSFVSVFGVYGTLNTSCLYQTIYMMCFTYENNIVRGFVCRDNSIPVMDVRQMFCNIRVFKKDLA